MRQRAHAAQRLQSTRTQRRTLTRRALLLPLRRRQVMDAHLEKLCTMHMETKFVRVRALARPAHTQAQRTRTRQNVAAQTHRSRCCFPARLSRS
jgi:hypothetical protein